MDPYRTNIWVANFLVQESGTYDAQWRRPYEIQTTGDNLQQLATRVDQLTQTNPGARIESNIIAGLSGGLVLPKAQPDSRIYIPNGFNEPRLRFILEVHVETRFKNANTEVYYFQGWSDYLGVSHSGFVDDNMRFDINSFVRVARSLDYSNLASGAYRDIIVEQAQVLNGQYYTQDASGNLQPRVYGLRPTDLFLGMHSCHYQNAMAVESYDSRVYDTRQDVSHDILRSRRSNAVPSHYLAKVLDDSRTAQMTADFGAGSEDIYTRAQYQAYEEPLNENPFIGTLSNIIGLPSVTYFTINNLLQIDPTARERMSFQPVAQAVRLAQTGDTNGWQAPTLDNALATMLINAVHSLMVQHMLVSVGFESTNETINGQPFTRLRPETVQGFTNADLTQHQNLFIRRLETEVIPDLTLNGLRRYNFVIYANLYNDTHLTLSFDGMPAEQFVTPTFCDALLAPVVTSDQDTYHGMVTGVEAITNQVGFSSSIMNTGMIDMSV